MAKSYDDAIETMQFAVFDTLCHYKKSGGSIPADQETFDQLSRAIVQELQHSKFRWAIDVVAKRWAEINRKNLTCGCGEPLSVCDKHPPYRQG